VLGIFVALKLEEDCVRAHLSDWKRARRAGGSVASATAGKRQILVCRTGVGAKAGSIAQALLAEERLQIGLSLGLCGGLDESLALGDLCLPSAFRLCEDNDSSAYFPDPGLVALAERAALQAGLRSVGGDCGTAEIIVGDPQQKRVLKDRFALAVVDMETYWVARAAAERQVPFLAARVVLDGAGDSLPPFANLLARDGALSPAAVLAHVARHPRDVVSLGSIAWRTRLARRTLKRFAGAFLAAWSEAA